LFILYVFVNTKLNIFYSFSFFKGTNRYCAHSVDNSIANLELKSKVMFSTVTLRFTEPARFLQEKIPNNQLETFEVGFGERMGIAFGEGWGIFLSFIVGITSIWVFILLLSLAAWAYWKYRKGN
jgi:hypothetical protein